MGSTRFTATAARVPSAHLVSGARSVSGVLLYAPDSGRLFAIDDGLHDALEVCARIGDEERTRTLMAGSGLLARRKPVFAVPQRVPMANISLAISSRCNLGCTYCYASCPAARNVDPRSASNLDPSIA